MILPLWNINLGLFMVHHTAAACIDSGLEFGESLGMPMPNIRLSAARGDLDKPAEEMTTTPAVLVVKIAA